MLTLNDLFARLCPPWSRRQLAATAYDALEAPIKYRPCLMKLEDRLLPGSLLSLGIPARPAGQTYAAATTRNNYSTVATGRITQISHTTQGAGRQTQIVSTTTGTPSEQRSLTGKDGTGDELAGLTDDLGSNLDYLSTRSPAPTSGSTTPARPDLGSSGGGGGSASAGGGAAAAPTPSGGGATTNTMLPSGFSGAGGAGSATSGQGSNANGSALPGSKVGALSSRQVIAPSGYGLVANAETRTQEQMTQVELYGPKAPAPPAGVAVNRPNPAGAQAGPGSQANLMSRPGSGTISPLGSVSPPHVLTPNVAGVTEAQAGFWVPPDSEGTIGLNNFVETTNDHLDIYSRTGVRQNGPVVGGVHQGVSMNAFIGYSTTAAFDSRVIYDPVWQRYIVTADTFAQSNGSQLFFIMVSKTSNPLGAWWKYTLDTTAFGGSNAGGIWDYPMLGQTQDAVLFSANEFFKAGGGSGELFGVAKARLYNGSGFLVPVFLLAFNPQLPNVIDQSDTAFIASNWTDSGHLLIYAFEDAANAFEATLSGPTAVAAYNAPPPRAANQPGTSAQLNVLDGRFQNTTTQNGSSLWLIHTVNAGGFPTPMWYEINTTTMTVNQNGFVFAAGNSDDFNPALVANSNNDVFVEWSSTNSNTGTNAQVLFGGRLHTDPLGNMPVQTTPLYTSPTFLGSSGVQPWGDYSAITVDPNNILQAWIVNEDIIDTSDWGTRIGHISF
jgi:hypothetical protein